MKNNNTKPIQFWLLKNEDLWLAPQVDDLTSEDTTHRPKVAFVVAINWWTFFERAYLYKRRPQNKTKFYKIFALKFYIGYYTLSINLRLNKMPYTDQIEYRAWRKANAKST